MRSLDQTPEVGTLGPREQPGSQSFAGRGGLSGYFEGYPATSVYGAEPNVSAQWIFDEASGNIVDQVGSLAIPVVGTPTYRVASSGVYVGLSPGITVASGKYFQLDTGATVGALSVGTGDWTLEAWVTSTTSASDQILFAVLDIVGLTGWYTFYFRPGSSVIQFFSTVGGNFTGSWNYTPSSFHDGNLHKVTMHVVRAGNITMKIDGVSLGTQDYSSRSSADFQTQDATIGAYVNGAVPWVGTIYEVRLSKNATNATPPG